MDLHYNRCFDDVDNQYNPLYEFKYDTDIELSDKMTLLAGQISAAEYCFLKMLAEFDRRECWRKGSIRSCSHWLSWKCGMTLTTAREKLRVAHCLEKLPKTNLAFKRGLLSYSKVRAMTRVATDDNEEILIKIAQGGTASHLEKLVRRFQRVDKNQQPIEQGDEYQQRDCVCYQDEEGMWIIRAKLPQVEGGLLVKAIEEIMRQLDKNASAEAFEQKRNASAEAFEQAQITVPAVEKRSFGQKCADALTSIAEHFIATATVDDENGGVQALAGHERCQVVLHLNADTLKHEQGESCHCQGFHPPANMDHQWISPANAKRFSSDASIYTVTEDTYGNVLNVGRRTRTITIALRRALNLRDETCRFPGCCANRYVDFHHIKHWSHFGETEPNNLIKLCRFHHAQLHKGNYTITVQKQTKENHGQKWTFRTPAGEVIEPNPKLPMPSNTNFMATQWPDITTKTGTSYWRGQQLNYPQALKDLLWCKYGKQAGYSGKKSKQDR